MMTETRAPAAEGKGSDLAHGPELSGGVPAGGAASSEFPGVVVENIVDYQSSGKGYAVPGLRFNECSVVDRGSPEVHQYGGHSVCCPEAQTNGAGTGVLHIENQLAQGDFLALPVDDKFML